MFITIISCCTCTCRACEYSEDWSVSSIVLNELQRTSTFFHADCKDWSDWADNHTDLSIFQMSKSFIIPTLFRKSVGFIVIASVCPSVCLSVRPSVRYVISSQTAGQNPTKFGEWLAYTSGACKNTFIFDPAPMGPGEGSKGRILTSSNFKVNFKDFYAKMCTYTQ